MLFEFMNGGLSYDPAVIAANTRDHLAWVLLFNGLGFFGGFVQMVGAIWVGFKHKSHGVPLLCATWFLADDATYFLNYQHWFHDMDYWPAQGAWFTMIFYVITELTVMYQIMKYSRDEVFPGMSFMQALLSLISLVVLGFAVFWWFMSMLNDPLYLFKFASTIIIGPLWLIPMMRARGSRKGFNLISLGGTILVAAGFWPWLFVIEPYFRQPMFFIIAFGNVAMGFVCLWYWRTLPEYKVSAATLSAALPRGSLTT
jgi:hypothetical protein